MFIHASRRAGCCLTVLALASSGLVRADDCGQYEAIPTFVWTLRAPELLTGDAGETVKEWTTAEILTCGLQSGEDGAQGWSMLVKLTNAVPVEATTDGTSAAPSPDGLRQNGFERTRLYDSVICGRIAATACVLSFTEDVTLDPGSPHDVLRVRFEAKMPLEGEALVGLELPEECGHIREVEALGDGGGGDQPIGALVTYRGSSYRPVLTSRTLRIAPHVFRRGDVNADARVDISDAIRMFMYLFLGAAEPPCLDALDSNDDSDVDLSDGIHILNDFFREGTGIPAPGPFDCGPDPTVDRLGCRAYDACS